MITPIAYRRSFELMRQAFEDEQRRKRVLDVARHVREYIDDNTVSTETG